ncbi:MAG: penicillin-binding transpeptidase domain-containing protein [Eubacteriales bacterium]|nr:penicillin-binding transpeptidase domain-containing protein [bacterium]MDY2791948.1 penicillin-binding transpeptidase domain-containing protein [Eubacteriales bacterium]
MKPTRIRLAVYALVIALLFGAMSVRLGKMTLVQGDSYEALAESKSQKTLSQYGGRGTIYDTAMNPLAYDRVSYNLQFYRDPTMTTEKDRKAYTEAIIKVIDIVQRNGKTMVNDFWLERGEDGKWRFNTGATTEKADASRIKSWRQNFALSSEDRYPVEKLFDTLCQNYCIPNSLTEEQKIQVLAVWQEQRMNNYRSLPVTIAYDVGYDVVCQIESQSMDLPGMSIEEGTERVYPQGETAAHVIGYTSKISTDNMDTYAEKGYPKDATVGSSGIEASLEDQLSPYLSYRQGSKTVEINKKGKIIRELSYEEPLDGNSVVLTLNLQLQKVAEQALAQTITDIRAIQEELIVNPEWLAKEKVATTLAKYEEDGTQISLVESGALVAMDPNSGKVLAMASLPSFDLSMFEGGTVSAAYWKELSEDERNPMYNRCISARDTPGSIFKLVTGLGALMEGATTLTEEISDEGKYMGLDTSRQPRCWISEGQRWKHADQTIDKAIAHSCNYYFYEMGFRLGSSNLVKWAAQLGLTSRTGIELNGESLSYVGDQQKLYDPGSSISNQYTSKPLYAYYKIKEAFERIGDERGIVYDQDRIDKAAKMLMDIAGGDLAKDDWPAQIRNILIGEMNLPSDYIARHLLVNEFYYYINDLRWTASETIMVAIGQSITQVTPIAVARYIAAIANGGTVYNAQIVDKIISPSGEVVLDKQPTIANVITGGEEYFAALQQGMKDVASGEDGTASKVLSPYVDYRIAAKTGTAQRTDLDVENNAWMVAYAPYDNPKIVVVVYIQNGYAAGNCGHAVGEVVKAYLDSLEETPSMAVNEDNTLAD